MEDEGIELVLTRATELRFEIRNCIHKANEEVPSLQEQMKEDEDEEEDDGAETLLNICDALESLETQLYALQNLNQRQHYVKDTALSEIDYSRKVLLKKLKDYKGKELTVIHEASTFAGETVHHNNHLLLPPCTMKQSKFKTSWQGLRVFINVAAKALLTFGVITVAGFGPNLKVLGLFQEPASEGRRSIAHCPPGKVLVLENGEARCLVKERVEVPFESVLRIPNVNYGCG